MKKFLSRQMIISKLNVLQKHEADYYLKTLHSYSLNQIIASFKFYRKAPIGNIMGRTFAKLALTELRLRQLEQKIATITTMVS